MKCALVVDDDPQVLAVAARWLDAGGYRVRTAGDFSNARADIQMLEPDVVVVDVRLGEYNGIQLGMLARHMRPDVHLVVMSSWDDPVLRREAGRIGAPYMLKPFGSADLLGAVGHAMGTSGTA